MLTELYESFKSKVSNLMENVQPTPPAADAPAEVKAVAPHNEDLLLASSDPKVKAHVEELLAERASMRNREKTLREAAVRAEKELSELKEAQQAEATKQLAEQGEFKKLYEAASAEIANYKAEKQLFTVQDAISKELSKHGAIDPGVAKLVLMEYKDSLQYKDGVVFGVAEAVEQYKMQSPAFFKAAEPAPAAPVAPTATGLTTPAPQPGKVVPVYFDSIRSLSKQERIVAKKEADEAWKALIAPLKGTIL